MGPDDPTLRFRPAARLARRLAPGLGLLLLAACSSLPGLPDGRFSVLPVANVLKPEGDVKVAQGSTSPGANDLGSDLKLSDRETDPAATLFFGDGFSGFDLTYEQYRRKNSRGNLAHDLGSLGAGEITKSDLDYFGWRLGYVAQLYGYDFPATVPLGTDFELTPHIQLGAGPAVHYLDQRLTVLGLGASVTEEVDAAAVVPLLALRGQLNLDRLMLRVDQSFSYGDWGDVTDLFSDTSITIRWEVTYDVQALVGMRILQLDTEGSSNGNDFETSGRYQGWILGLNIDF
jgi:hypothetical protein